MKVITSGIDGQVECEVSNEDRFALIQKYNIDGPRYTSYPTAAHFSEAFNGQTYRSHMLANDTKSIAPLSLYVHIPFCQNICYYCACNKIVTSDHGVARQYLHNLSKEIAMQAQLLGRHRPVVQLHLGGGTPTFLDGAELTELMHCLASHFSLIDSDTREYSIEIDPRTVTSDSLALLKGLGFNRISLGVQDFDIDVQKAINREQSVELVKELTDAARLYQFNSISFDLIYGLPKQTVESLTETLHQVINLSPDRIAFYNYAHLPERFTSQRAIDRQGLPSVKEKITMLSLISRLLVKAGYVHIGMDHFVKPDDELAIAQKNGKLQRNFQGYSTSMAQDLIGLGVSSISVYKEGYAQNERDLNAYYQRLERGELAISRGYAISEDDRIRRSVITQIICTLQLDIALIENQYAINFREYFASEIHKITSMEQDNIVFWRDNKLVVNALGRVVLRNICMVFDKYLTQQQPTTQAIVYSSAL